MDNFVPDIKHIRDVIAKAKANNMPNDTIDRGIKKAAGDAGSVNYEFVSYEGYGPNGTAIIVDLFPLFCFYFSFYSTMF